MPVRVVDELLGGMADADFVMNLDALGGHRCLELREHAAMVLARILDHRLGLDIVADFRRPRDREDVELGSVFRREFERRVEGFAAGHRAVIELQDEGSDG